MRVGFVACTSWFVVCCSYGASGHDCQRTDGSGPCCYRIDAGFTENSQSGAPHYNGSPLTGPAIPAGSQLQPIVHGYALAEPYFQFEDWGWKDGNGDVFNYLEQQQFVFPMEVAENNDEIQITIKSQDGCEMPEATNPLKYRALWQDGLADVFPGEWSGLDGGSADRLSVDYAKYTNDPSRARGDPIYITVIPCTEMDTNDECTEFDPSRAIAVMISFRKTAAAPATSPELACNLDGETEAGFDCCYVTDNIGPFATQEEIDASVQMWTSPNGNKPKTSCLKKPSWQCFRNDAGNVASIQYKGSLVDFIAPESGRKEGQGTRIVLADRVTINLPITTTYLEYTVDPNAQDSCDSLCDAFAQNPNHDDIIRESDGSCVVSAVSSFAEVNKGQVSVSGFGRIDGLPFHALKDHYFDDWSPNYDSSVDWSPGASCPSCNRFCPLTPYAWGVHALTVSCDDPLTPRTSSLRSELGDALYHMDSALLEISSNAEDMDQFAVDISDVTVSNMLKRGDAAVMVQSPGHLVRSKGCESGGLPSMQKGCQGPNLPAKIYGLKYMGGWHDAVDGPSLKSEGSWTQYMYLHNADDAVKPYSHSTIRDTTVIHGGVGGVVTPCTYNLQSYTPGCQNTKTINTHVVRIMDPNAGYEIDYPRGGILATRYCAGKTSVGAAWMTAEESIVENNIVDGLVVNSLGLTRPINQVGRAVAVTVTKPMDGDYEVWYCQSYYDHLAVHLKMDAFVAKRWWIEPSTYKFDWVDGSGTALIETAYAWELAVVDSNAVDLRGIAQRITDPAGLKCGFKGYYYPCDNTNVDGDQIEKTKKCFVFLDGDSQWKSFDATGQVCDDWESPRNVVCKGTDDFGEYFEGQCPGTVNLPWGTSEPTFNPLPELTQTSHQQILLV